MIRSVSLSQTLRQAFRIANLLFATTFVPIAFAQSGYERATSGKPRVARSLNALPLSFERNEGRAASEVRYLSRGADYLVSLTDNDAFITLRKKTPRQTTQNESGPNQSGDDHLRSFSAETINMHLVNSSASTRIAGDGPLPGTVNYFLGSDPSRWRSGVPTFKRVKYTGVYPGVDLVYYGNQRQLEFDFEVAPGADPSRIELSFAGARRLNLDHEGNLILSTTSGAVSFHKPVIYQTVSGMRQPDAQPVIFFL
jgi:hypothetical protein